MTSSNVTPGSHVIGSALGMLSKTSASYYRFLALSLVFCPFPAILLAPSIITQKFILFGYVRGCCVVLQGCPRSHCGISKSQMNEMVNFVPYFSYHFTIQLTFLPYFPDLFTIQLTFPRFLLTHLHNSLNDIPNIIKF